MTGAKTSISEWWLFALVALFLWYRNENYDRVMASYVFITGLIQLVEYGIYSGADALQAGRSIFIILWIQCLVLNIGVFLFLRDYNETDSSPLRQIVGTISGWILILYSVIFVVALFLLFTENWNLKGELSNNGYVEWKTEDTSILGNWNFLYLLGILIPFFLLLAYYSWADLHIAILLLYLVLSGVYVMIYYPTNSQLSMWSYYSIGFAFLAWFLGIFPSYNLRNRHMEI